MKQKKKKWDRWPMSACFSMDLYCDHENTDHVYQEFPHQFTGETRGECLQEARQKGWVIHRDNTATCPKCSKVPEC